MYQCQGDRSWHHCPHFSKVCCPSKVLTSILTSFGLCWLLSDVIHLFSVLSLNEIVNMFHICFAGKCWFREYLWGIIQGDAFRTPNFRAVPNDYVAKQTSCSRALDLSPIPDNFASVADERFVVTIVQGMYNWSWHASDDTKHKTSICVFHSHISCMLSLWLLAIILCLYTLYEFFNFHWNLVSFQ